MNLLTLVILRHFIAKKKQMYPSFIHAHSLLTLFYIVQTHTFKVLKEQGPFCVAKLSTPGFLVRSDFKILRMKLTGLVSLLLNIFSISFSPPVLDADRQRQRHGHTSVV